MAKKRKTTPKRKPKAARKTAATKSAPSATAASSKTGKSKSGKLSPEDTLTALMIGVAIVIVLAAIYLYQQNSKPKTAQLPPAITFIAPV